LNVELLAELDPQLITKTRLGARKAQELYRSVRPWHSDELLPLELVQIDHTQLDVMVVDESQRMVLGQPWLTLAIDVASRGGDRILRLAGCSGGYFRGNRAYPTTTVTVWRWVQH
jgi:hypothetical protein